MKKISHKTKSQKVRDIAKEIETFLKRNAMANFKKRELAKVLGYTSAHEYEDSNRRSESSRKRATFGRVAVGNSVPRKCLNHLPGH